MAGLDLGLIVGLAAGLLSFIPYVGSITGGVTAIGLALAQFPHWRGVIVVGGVLVVGQILEGYVIYPRFLGDRVELPAVWVIFALFAGGAAFGFLGVMLAVPVAATIGVLCRFWLRRYLASPLYLDPPDQAITRPSARPAAVDQILLLRAGQTGAGAPERVGHRWCLILVLANPAVAAPGTAIARVCSAPNVDASGTRGCAGSASSAFSTGVAGTHATGIAAASIGGLPVQRRGWAIDRAGSRDRRGHHSASKQRPPGPRRGWCRHVQQWHDLPLRSSAAWTADCAAAQLGSRHCFRLHIGFTMDCTREADTAR